MVWIMFGLHARTFYVEICVDNEMRSVWSNLKVYELVGILIFYLKKTFKLCLS